MDNNNNIKTIPICELFVSIQGEGIRAGYPAIFIRVSGCNLRCVFGNTICDTAYSSFSPEKGSVTTDDVFDFCCKKHGQVRDIVITGGEPMLYKDQLIKMMNAIAHRREYEQGDNYCYPVFTIETNGTLPIIEDEDIPDAQLLISCSPKLSTAFTATAGVPISLPDGTTVTFTQKQIDNYNSRRINIDNLANMVLRQMRMPQFKFVYSSEASVMEIKDILHRLNNRITELEKSRKNIFKDSNGNICYRHNQVHEDPSVMYNVYLMPEGIDEETLQKTRQGAVNACIENNWRYTDRLHIIIWGMKRGV